ncbi:MAG: pyruvate kinase, partial [Candidatus Acidiferrales bacterium]
MKFRHAKIVCTLGPASDSLPMITSLMRAGMDVARVNFSHGNHERHAELIGRLRQASAKLQKPIALVADLQGPKIRTGLLVEGKPVQLRSGQRFTISTGGEVGTSLGVSTSYRRLPREVKRGDRILLADGLIELRVKSAGQTEIVCEVSNGGELGEHKGINLPGVHL